MTILFKGDVLITTAGKEVLFNSFLKDQLGNKIGIVCQLGNSYLFTDF